MPRVNIWLPEDLHRAAKNLGLPLSELDDELGPATPDQIAEADGWAARLPSSGTAHGNKSRSA